VDLNRILIWFTLTAGAVLFVRALRARRRGWAGVSLAVVAATLGGLPLWPGAAGYVGGALAAVLIFLPLKIYHRMTLASLQRRYAAARRLARVLRWLHPMDGFWELPHVLDALAAGGPAAAAQAAQQTGAARTGFGRLGTTLLFRMNNQWAELQEWVEANVPDDELRRDPTLSAVYIRSFGELGDANGLLAAYDRLYGGHAPPGGPLRSGMVRLIPLAFCGRERATDILFRGPLAVYPETVQRFWRATAAMANGSTDARAALESLREDGDDALTIASIAWRLDHAVSQTLSPESRAGLDEIERAIDQEARFGVRAPDRRVAWATALILAVNLLVFAVEVARGGSESYDTLLHMGGMLPSAVARGEWGRLFLANVLHYGTLHLAMNMVALLVLGPFVERSLGWLRYAVVYVLAGVGAMAGILALARLGLHGDHLVVGASGCVMGLIGATGAVLLRGWARERAHAARRRLGFIAFVIGFQVLFDLTSPDISFIGHVGGLLIGFVAASLVRHAASERG